MSKQGSLASLMDKAISSLKTSLLGDSDPNTPPPLTPPPDLEPVKEVVTAPYAFRKIKKLVRIEGARRLVIWFDCRCNLVQERHALRIYRDPNCSFLLASYSSSGVHQWLPLVVESDHFWYTFKRRVPNSELDPNEWGFKFTVWPETSRQLSLRSGLALIYWSLNLEVTYWPTIALSLKESVALLMAHLHPTEVPVKQAQPAMGSQPVQGQATSALTPSSALTLAIGLVTTKPIIPQPPVTTYPPIKTSPAIKTEIIKLLKQLFYRWKLPAWDLPPPTIPGDAVCHHFGFSVWFIFTFALGKSHGCRIDGTLPTRAKRDTFPRHTLCLRSTFV